jgi:hypothetical protein
MISPDLRKGTLLALRGWAEKFNDIRIAEAHELIGVGQRWRVQAVGARVGGLPRHRPHGLLAGRGLCLH